MADDISIRRATFDHLPRMLGLDTVQERADELGRAVAEGRCRVAVVGGRIVGFFVAGTCVGHDPQRRAPEPG